jgi:ABC-type nitrate/sulfonate/bicarbonate transport system ATPase subunit
MMRISSLTRKFPGGRGVLGVDLELAEGESCAIIGPSGCGKTTLLHLLCGLAVPDGGRIEFVSGRAPSIGLVQQKDALYPWLTGLENATLALPEERRRGRELLEQLGVGHCANSYPRQMSGGERQRVSLARTLLTEPRLLLLDEPSASLDELTRECLQDLILELQTRLSMAAIYVTHSIEEALFLASRIYIMIDGRLAEYRENPGYPDPQARDSQEYYHRVVDLRRRFAELTR